jgi:hypothetical protein
MADLPNPHQGFGIGRQPDPRTSIQQIHENFIIELASLSYDAKGQKVRDYIRRTMIHQMISPTELAVQFRIPRETLCRWIREIRNEVEQPQSSVFGVAQGMVPIPGYPLAAATSANSVLLGSARRPTPIQVHPDPYSNPLHGYAAAVASAAAGAGSQVINTFIALHFRPHTNSHILAVLTSTAAGCVLSRRLQDFPVSARAFEASWADKLFAASVTAASVIAAQLSCPRPRYRALASQQQIYAIIWLRAREQRVIRCLLIASSRAGCRLVRHPDVGWQRVPRCTIGGFWPGIPPHTPPLTSTKLFSHRDCGSDSPLLLVCRVRNVCCTIEEGIMCHSGDGHASAAPSRDDPASVSLS